MGKVKSYHAHKRTVLGGRFESKLYLGDIAVSENTVQKFLNTSDSFDAGLWRAFSNSKNLWDQNFVNGEYIIAYEINPSLMKPQFEKLISLLSKVRFRFKSIRY